MQNNILTILGPFKIPGMAILFNKCIYYFITYMTIWTSCEHLDYFEKVIKSMTSSFS
jgi:hypothetical protein